MKQSIKDLVFNQLKYGFLYKQRLKTIKSYQELTTEDLLFLENKKLVHLVNKAYSKTLFYKDLFNDYGVNLKQIQNKEDLTKLPIITKDLIKDRVDSIYLGNKLIRHKSYTSGTSGSPLKVYYGLNCVINEACYNEVFRNNAGHYFGDKVVSLRGALDGTTREYFDKFNNILYLSSYHINEQNASWYYDKIKKFNPKTILAYPSSLEALTNILVNKGFKINIPLAFTSSETLYPHQQDKIEEGINTKVFDRYGNAERTISLVQYEHRGQYTFPNLYSINEFVKEGKIITTSLINPQFPLIRYEVNDLVQVNDNNKVDYIGGRIDDQIMTPDGLQVGSAAMSLAFKKIPNILISQIIQDHIENITVNIVVNEAFSHENKLKLHKELKQRLGGNMSIIINKIDETQIIKTTKNKFKLIISSIK